MMLKLSLMVLDSKEKEVISVIVSFLVVFESLMIH